MPSTSVWTTSLSFFDVSIAEETSIGIVNLKEHKSVCPCDSHRWFYFTANPILRNFKNCFYEKTNTTVT
eukprot:m.70610 g.70610  ORF g.70610 m.70610 type:complete len:69 (-) comp11672_c0_seq2:83-289(-)